MGRKANDILKGVAGATIALGGGSIISDENLYLAAELQQPEEYEFFQIDH